MIVRFGGEIGIKAQWTRRLYERRLLSNIKAVLRLNSIDHVKFIRTFGRLYIKTAQAEETAERLTRIFGISSVSPAFETTSNIDQIIDASLMTAKMEFKKDRSFAVHCRRVGKHSYTSQDICRTVGKEILTKLPELRLHVDLTNPKQQLGIEIREQRAYVFTDSIKAAGGLPLGTQSKTVCLLKGDAPSTIACWMAMKRGSPPIMLHLKNDQSFRTAKEAAEELTEWAIGFPSILRTVEYDTSLQRFLNKQPTDLRRLLCKRLLLRVAQRLAQKEHAEAIITGDVLDPDRNKTIHTLRMQDEAARNYPVLTPLLGFNAEEIKKLTQQINPKTTNARKKTKPRKTEPTVQIVIQDVEQIENKINMDKTIENITKSIKTIRLNNSKKDSTKQKNLEHHTIL